VTLSEKDRLKLFIPSGKYCVMIFTYEELQLMQREAPVKSGVLTFDESTQDIQFLTLTDKKDLKEVRITAPQPKLQYLDLGRCRIEKFVVSAKCENLRALHLHHNKLIRFEIDEHLPVLELLDFSFNENLTDLTVVPNLPLQYLYLHKCNLKDLSAFSGYFTKKDFDFNIEKNDNLISPPAEYVKQGKDAILSYFSSKLVDNKEVKVILLGNTTAGKTSLVEYLLTNNYPPERSTHGIQIKIWQPADRDFIATFWDFGGQEYYHATHRLFLTNNTIYLVVWNKCNNRTAEIPTTINLDSDRIEERTLQHFHHIYWLKLIQKQFAPDSPIIAIQNKIDLDCEQNIDQHCKEEYGIIGEYQISIEKAALEPDSDYREDFLRFEKRFKDSIHNFIKSAAPEGAEAGKIPRYVSNIRDYIRKQDTNYQNFKSFSANAMNAAEQGGDPLDEKELEIAIKYLTDTGVLLYYGYDPLMQNSMLQDYIFLKPNFVTQTIYNILDEQVQQRGGEFDFAHVLKSTNNEQEASLFIELMQSPNFELVFKFDESYYASQFLADRNDVVDCYKDELEFAFALHFPNFYSQSFISRFIARYGHDSEKQYFCKSGILIKRRDTGKPAKNGNPLLIPFLILANIKEEQITVLSKVEGKKHRFIRKIYETFLEFADGDQNVEIKIAEDMAFASLSEIERLNLGQYNIERLHNPLVYETSIDGNRIKVEGNGNIVLQDVRGVVVNINIKDIDMLTKRLSGEHTEILQQLQEIKQKIPSLDLQDKLFELVEQYKSVGNLEKLIKEMEQRIQKRLSQIEQYLLVMHEMLKAKEIDIDQVNRMVNNINSQNQHLIVEVGKQIMGHINWAFEQHENEMDEKLKEIYADLRQTDNIETRIKLSVPLLNLLGLNIETDIKLNDFIKWLESKYL
jgi:GTPase SAR1 family protein